MKNMQGDQDEMHQSNKHASLTRNNNALLQQDYKEMLQLSSYELEAGLPWNDEHERLKQPHFKNVR